MGHLKTQTGKLRFDGTAGGSLRRFLSGEIRHVNCVLRKVSDGSYALYIISEKKKEKSKGPGQQLNPINLVCKRVDLQGP